MDTSNLKINAQSIRTELKSYENKPYECLFEYIWNSFDANATEVRLDFVTPIESIGLVRNVTLTDNGNGWDFDDEATTNNFMSSTKIPNKNKTLPKGQYGRGRYSFIWIADKIEIFSGTKKLILQHNTEIHKEVRQDEIKGTKIVFININELFSDILNTRNLEYALSIEFGWFLSENSDYKIIVNNNEVKLDSIIKSTKEYTKSNLPNFLRNKLDDNFYAKIIIWKDKLSEFSKFYFLDNSNFEIYKRNSGLNKKSDNFWHSVYIKSSLFFNDYIQIEEDDEDAYQQKIEFDDSDSLRSQIIEFFKKELVQIRKPYLKKQSEDMYKTLKEKKIIPNLNKFGIYDNESYEDLIKTVYTITPSLFANKSDPEKKFVCATFAALLSNQDNNLIKIVLEQLQELSEEEKQDLFDILNRTRLSNVIATIKEIDHRIYVIENLKILLSEYEKDTLEVKHIQKILDDNFWIFGEQFRLFSTTEGSLKNILNKYASEILHIEESLLSNRLSGEVDLFLTKTEYINETCQKNIIVELKRPSKNLGKEEYDQIENYMEKITQTNLCNGENQYWEFYLIGKNYNSHIENKIDSAKNHGEKIKGLCYNIKDGRFKIYVRKWSDILEVEWGSKLKYLQNKLKINPKEIATSPGEITNNLLHQ